PETSTTHRARPPGRRGRPRARRRGPWAPSPPARRPVLRSALRRLHPAPVRDRHVRVPRRARAASRRGPRDRDHRHRRSDVPCRQARRRARRARARRYRPRQRRHHHPFGGRAFPCTPGGGPIFGCEALLAGPLVPDALPPDAMDMETAAVARVAGDAGVPYVAFRGVSDGSGDPLGLPGFPAQFFAYYRLAAENAAAVTTAFLAASNLSDTDRADRARGRRVTSRRPRVAAACDWERAASPACAGERAPRAIKNRVARACRLLAKAAAATPGSAAARMAERRERKSWQRAARLLQ